MQEAEIPSKIMNRIRRLASLLDASHHASFSEANSSHQAHTTTKVELGFRFPVSGVPQQPKYCNSNIRCWRLFEQTWPPQDGLRDGDKNGEGKAGLEKDKCEGIKSWGWLFNAAMMGKCGKEMT